MAKRDIHVAEPGDYRQSGASTVPDADRFGNVGVSVPGPVSVPSTSRADLREAAAIENVAAKVQNLAQELIVRDRALTYAAEEAEDTTSFIEMQEELERAAKEHTAYAGSEDLSIEEYDRQWEARSEDITSNYLARVEGYRSEQKSVALRNYERYQQSWRSAFQAKYSLPFRQSKAEGALAPAINRLMHRAASSGDWTEREEYISQAFNLLDQEKYRALFGNEEVDRRLAALRAQVDSQYLINLTDEIAPPELEDELPYHPDLYGVKQAQLLLSEQSDYFEEMYEPEELAALVGQLDRIERAKISDVNAKMVQAQREANEQQKQYVDYVQRAALGFEDMPSRESFERDFREGRIDSDTLETVTNVHDKWLEEVQETSNLEVRLSEIAGGFRAGNPDDTEDVKAVDLGYTRLKRIAQLQEFEPVQTMNSIVQLANNTNIVPRQMVTDLQSEILVNDDVRAGLAGQTLRRLVQNPSLAAQIKLTEEQNRRIGYLDAGYSAEQTQRMVEQERTIPVDEKRARADFFSGSDNRELRDDALEELQETLDDNYVQYGGWFQPDVPELTPGLKSYFLDRMKTHYVRTQDTELARRAAERDANIRYSITGVNGTPEWTTNSPERMFGAPTPLIVEQFNAELTDEGLVLGENARLEFDPTVNAHVVKVLDDVIQDYVYWEGPTADGQFVYPWVWEYEQPAPGSDRPPPEEIERMRRRQEYENDPMREAQRRWNTQSMGSMK